MRMVRPLLLMNLCLNLGLTYHTYSEKLLPTTPPSPSQETKVSTPVLASQTCYQLKEREPWEPEVSGIIVMRGASSYLVMSEREAERRHGGSKTAFPISVETFNRLYQPTSCPKAWVEHTAGKKPHAKKQKDRKGGES